MHVCQSLLILSFFSSSRRVFFLFFSLRRRLARDDILSRKEEEEFHMKQNGTIIRYTSTRTEGNKKREKEGDFLRHINESELSCSYSLFEGCIESNC